MFINQKEFLQNMKKRRFQELRNSILNLLKNKKEFTLNQIARSAKINWKTVDNHITYLIGRGFVKEIFNSPYVRIVQITERGLKQLKK
jgi:predicted transcriptional regulator